MRSKLYWIGLGGRAPSLQKEAGRSWCLASRGGAGQIHRSVRALQQDSTCFLERKLPGVLITLAVTTSWQKSAFSHPTNTEPGLASCQAQGMQA